MNWYCICGNFVREKRFCPRCKLVRFRIENSPILDYWGLNVGELSNGLPFNFPINYLSGHVLVTGQTGTGKTRFAMNLAVKTENHVSIHPIKLLVVDVEGEWKNIIPKMKNWTEYFSVDKNLKINPFDLGDPALIRELFRETIFKGIEKEYVDLSAQMNFVLQEAINESHSMEELIRNIKDYNKQKLTALDKTKTALLVRLDPFMRSPLKEIFFCKKSHPDFNDIDDHNVVIDLHELDKLVAYGSELRLIYNTITTYFLRKMLNRGTCDWVSNIFVADEAQLLVPKILQKIVVTESWPATEFATRLRKRGCGLVLITQSPSNIEKDIFKNMGTKVSFRLQHQEDIKLISEAAGFMDYVEYEFLSDRFVRLPRRTAIVCTSGHEPFVMTASEFDMSTTTIVAAYDTAAAAEAMVSEDVDEKTFLESIEKDPFISVRKRRTSLGWNDKRYYKAVDALIQKKKIEIEKVRVGRGTPTILYQKIGKIPSVRHQYYVNWIVEKIKEKGFDFTTNILEGPDIEIPKISTVIEVELGKSDVHSNITRNIQKFDKVIVCSDNKKLLQTLSAQNKSNKVLFSQIENVPALIEKMPAQNELEDI
ncbi:MAG TPA: ATP-binding protein [Candidatus Nitrosotalea sp.]|nr:ATP-binding protein [Candidatus Nitrosotalea sp.]